MRLFIFYEDATPYLREGMRELGGPWLKLHAYSAEGMGSIPGWRTKILYVKRRGQKKKRRNC